MSHQDFIDLFERWQTVERRARALEVLVCGSRAAGNDLDAAVRTAEGFVGDWDAASADPRKDEGMMLYTPVKERGKTE